MSSPEGLAADPPAAADRAPTRTLSRRALTQWRLEGLVVGVGLILVSLILRTALDSSGAPRLLLDALVPLATLAALGGVLALPRLRWRHWRYEVSSQEIDLRHGLFTIVRTIVPMARVQHVETRRTFTSQVFQTATLVLHTAAGAVEIPLLDEPVAIELRDRIAQFARAPDDDDEL